MSAGPYVSIPTTRHDNPRLAEHHPPGPVELVDVGKVQLRRPEIIDLQLVQRLPIRLAEVSLPALTRFLAGLIER